MMCCFTCMCVCKPFFITHKVPRVSLSVNAKLRSCDVYIGYNGQSPNLIRFCKWLKSELQLQGIACFVAVRAKYSDSQSHEVADRVICSVTFGIVVVTKDSLFSYLSLEEIRFFAQKGNLITLFLYTDSKEVVSLLGLDVNADEEKERGRIRTFDEQETEAFKRVKQELFRDMPYLIVSDNLETENAWWEGKDLHDLIPINTGGSHVIITTRLTKVMSFDTMQLQPLPLKDAILFTKGRRKKEYPDQEVDFLTRFHEKLERSSFGLSVIGSLLSELAVAPSTLFEAINNIRLDEEVSSHFDERFWGNNANVVEEVEKSFVTEIQDWCHGSLKLCWKKKKKADSHQRIDEYVWQDVTLLKAILLESRAKLLLRGGCFDNGEELCRTCISIRTVMLGHNHAQTLAAQETLAKLVTMRSKI